MSKGKEITLGDWLKDMDASIQIRCEPATNSYMVTWIEGFTTRGRTTTEDALQDLCEDYHHDDSVLLDIGRSAKWTAAHGPDGVAGLCDREVGVVVCRNGALHLLDRFPARSHFVWAQNLEDLRAMCDQAATVVPLDGSGDLPARNTFETGLPVVYPDPAVPQKTSNALFEAVMHDDPGCPLHERLCALLRDYRDYEQRPDPDTIAGQDVRPAETSLEEENELDAPEPSRAECLKASLESLLATCTDPQSIGQGIVFRQLLKTIVEAVTYLLEQYDTKEENHE